MGVRVSSFSFNGISSDSFGVRVESRYILSSPSYERDSVSVPGRDGDIFLSGGRFPNVTVSYTCFLTAGSAEELSDRVARMREWLYGAGDGYAVLRDSADTAGFRYAVLSGGIEANVTLRRLARFTVSFSCLPHRYLDEGLYPITAKGALTAVNPTACSSLPRIRIEADGDVSLTLENTDGTSTWRLSGLSGGIELDSACMDAVWNGENRNACLAGDGFPVLPPGRNLLTAACLSDTDSTPVLTVTPNWRCL